MKSTKETYCLEGMYAEDRRELHKKIIAEILEGSNSGNTEPESFLVGGGTASGKGYASRMVIDAYKTEGTLVVHIDADVVKEKLPEYNEFIASGERELLKLAATLVHDESSDITEELLNICIAENRHFIFDGTMKNKEKYEKIIEKLRGNKYNIRVFVVDISLELALQRAAKRFEDTYRYVPVDVITDSHKNIASTFFSIKDKVDSYSLFDNTSEENAVTAFAIKLSDESGEEVIDQSRLKEFYAKSNINIEKVEGTFKL